MRGADGAIEGWQPGNNLVLDVPAEDAVLQVTDDWEGESGLAVRPPVGRWREGGGCQSPNRLSKFAVWVWKSM